MKRFVSNIKFFVITIFLLAFLGCLRQTENSVTPPPDQTKTNRVARNSNFQGPEFPKLQAEILNAKDSKTKSPLGEFDFKNFTYPLPRGWQDRDGKDLVLENGKRRMTKEKIGMSYVTTKFFDVTDDGKDEAFVILKVTTGSIAIPQIVYIFEWKEEKPEMIWYFGTGDRADGGLKKLYSEDGELIIELFGRDRYIFNQMVTSEIVGDDQRLCCPTDFTRNRYKKVGKKFVRQGDRLTYLLSPGDAEPIKNMNEKKLKEERGSKQ